MSTDHPALQAYFAQLEAAPTPALTPEEKSQIDALDASYQVFAEEHGKYSARNLRDTSGALKAAINDATTPEEIDQATEALAIHEATAGKRYETYSFRMQKITRQAVGLLLPAYEREVQSLIDHRDALKAIDVDLQTLGLTAGAAIAEVQRMIDRLGQNIPLLKQVQDAHAMSSTALRRPARMATDLDYQAVE